MNGEPQTDQVDEAAGETVRYRNLSLAWKALVGFQGSLAVFIILYKNFNLGRFFDFYPLESYYYYAIFGLLIPGNFILFHARKSGPARVPLLDIFLFALSTTIALVFTLNSRIIVEYGWDFAAPEWARWAAVVIWLLLLDAVRRSGGLSVFIVVAVVSMYPVFGGFDFFGVFQIDPETFLNTIQFHVFGSEGILGIPLRAMVNLVIGFLLFGVTLQHTGAGKFFIDLSFALLGTTRGGPAKVSIASSALMGSISGSPASNVVTSGVMTIPAMVRAGFSPAKAGAIEACASTGGVLLPPIMGSTAFIMASFLDIPYAEVAIAAIIPSFLYFFGLFVQIDAYAAKNSLKGVPKADLKNVFAVLASGWQYIFVIGVLIWLLFFLKQEAIAPFYTTALLIVINQVFPANRWSLPDIGEYIFSAAKLFIEIATLLAGVGMLIGSLIISGKVGKLAFEMVEFAGSSVTLLIVTGAILSLVLGMGMTITAAYLFLAVSLAPALVQAGLDQLASHLFILYLAMVSFITPPIAFASFTASIISRAGPMKTSFESMRLGSIMYFIPFFFVLEPALIGRGSPEKVAMSIMTAIAGVMILASTLQGYVVFLGPLDSHRLLHWPIRALLFCGGIGLMIPGGENFGGYSGREFLLLSATLIGAAISLLFLGRWLSSEQQG